MLHYCAGLQNCLDTQEQVRQEEEEKQQKLENGLSQVEAAETAREGIPKIVTEGPSICDNDDSESDDGEPIFIKADDNTKGQTKDADSVS